MSKDKKAKGSKKGVKTKDSKKDVKVAISAISAIAEARAAFMEAHLPHGRPSADAFVPPAAERPLDEAFAEAAEAVDRSSGAARPPSDFRHASDLGGMYDVEVQIAAILGTAKLRIADLLRMGRGAVIELDRKVGEAIEIRVNDRVVARGEVVVVEDRLGVTLTEIVKPGR